MEPIKTVVTARSERDVALSVIQAVALSPARIVVVRAVRVYLMTLLAFLLAAGIQNVAPGTLPAADKLIPAGDFVRLLATGLSVSLAPAAVSALWNVVELLARLDEKAPQLRA